MSENCIGWCNLTLPERYSWTATRHGTRRSATCVRLVTSLYYTFLIFMTNKIFFTLSSIIYNLHQHDWVPLLAFWANSSLNLLPFSPLDVDTGPMLPLLFWEIVYSLWGEGIHSRRAKVVVEPELPRPPLNTFPCIVTVDKRRAPVGFKPSEERNFFFRSPYFLLTGTIT